VHLRAWRFELEKRSLNRKHALIWGGFDNTKQITVQYTLGEERMLFVVWVERKKSFSWDCISYIIIYWIKNTMLASILILAHLTSTTMFYTLFDSTIMLDIHDCRLFSQRKREKVFFFLASWRDPVIKQLIIVVT
jgi:hypothetical protein